ncbi:unnamed protein product, partial [Adineta ricciae]
SDTTPEYLLLACYYAFLFKLTNGEQDLCIGMNINGRYKDELHSIIGSFVTTLPCRVQLDPNSSFEQLVEQVRDRCLSVLEHSHYPLQHIIGSHHAPAFLETMFDYITIDSAMEQVNLNGALLQSTSFEQYDHVAKFDMMLTLFQHSSDRLSCSLICSQDVFSEKTVQTLADRFVVLLQQLFDHETTSTPLYQLSLLLPDESALMLTLNQTESEVMSSEKNSQWLPIGHAFNQQAQRHPQKVAVELDDQCLTYSELFIYVQRLSMCMGHRQNQIICQCIERSIEMVIGQLAILSCGAAYCALSPDDPPTRLDALVTQVGAEVVLVHSKTHAKFDGMFHGHLIDVGLIDSCTDYSTNIGTDHSLHCDSSPDSLAYVVFTSGSTGTPKAVPITHRNFVACMTSFEQLGILTAMDVVIQVAPSSFDVHVKECIGTLMLGSSLVLLHPQGHLDIHYLSSTIQQHNVTFFCIVPSHMTILSNYLIEQNEYSRLRSVRKFGFLGEAIIPKTLTAIVAHVDKNTVAIYNLYGPAECTLTSVYHRVTMDDIEQGSIPIGKPLINNRCVVVDQFSQPTMIDEPGELLIGGAGVFPGYLGQQHITEKALVEIHGTQFYRTGDIVRVDRKGLLHYIGRKDHQVKLHGQRIELGAAVVKYNADHLVAYVQSDRSAEIELRDYCRSRLPPFMIPSAFIVLDQFPLNSNGKLDRKRLPTPDFSSAYNRTADAPQSPLQK